MTVTNLGTRPADDLSDDELDAEWRVFAPRNAMLKGELARLEKELDDMKMESMNCEMRYWELRNERNRREEWGTSTYNTAARRDGLAGKPARPAP